MEEKKPERTGQNDFEVEEGQFVNPPAIELDERGHERFSYKRLLAVIAVAIITGLAGFVDGIAVAGPNLDRATVIIASGGISAFTATLLLVKRLRVLD